MTSHYELVCVLFDKDRNVSRKRNTVGVRNQNCERVCSHERESRGAIFLTVKFWYVHCLDLPVETSRGRNYLDKSVRARSGLLWQDNALAVDCFEDRISATLEQGFANGFPELNRIRTFARLAQNLGSVRIGYNGFEM